LKYKWGELDRENNDYYNRWELPGGRQWLGLGAAFGPKRFRLPVVDILWVKQAVGAIILAVVILAFLAWDSPALRGVQERLRYLVAEERSDMTPALETLVREGLWLDPYERQVFKDSTGSVSKAEEIMSIPVSGQFSRKFGWIESISGNKAFHSGIDIETELNAPIRAALTGVVAKVDSSDKLGRFIVLDHGDGLTTVYGTLGEILVEENQAVKQGQIIAKAGKLKDTGRGQLHFEVRENNKAVDPLEKIANVKTSI